MITGSSLSTKRTVLRILHLSDLHFGPPFSLEAAEAALRLSHDEDLDLIVISGDFTQRAKRYQFEEARDFIRRLPPLPKIVVPGNHDVPLYRVFERLITPHKLYREYIGPELDTAHTIGEATIVALNSTAPRTAISNGRITSSQLAWSEGIFSQAPPSSVKIIVAHHHFAPAPDYEKSPPMPFARRAIDSFVKAGVELILGGHLHRAYIGNSLDLYPAPDPRHGIIIAQCGTTTSRRGRGKEKEKNSLNIIRIEEGEIRVMHYLYMGAGIEGFIPMSEHIFRRTRSLF